MGQGVKKLLQCPSDVEVRKVGAAELKECRDPKTEDQSSFRGHKAASLGFRTFFQLWL